MLTFFPPLHPSRERPVLDRLSAVLQRILSTTEVTKNVNKNNATHGVLFEAIHVIIHQASARPAPAAARAARARTAHAADFRRAARPPCRLAGARH